MPPCIEGDKCQCPTTALEKRHLMDPVAFLMVMLVLLLIVIDVPIALLMVSKLQV
jgi:hypothetical protein